MPSTRDPKILTRFPKQRPELPEAYQRIYLEHYKRNREGASPASAAVKWMESWMHRQVAADTATRPAGYTTLEVGAGTLNHLEYEPTSTHYDAVEPLAELYRASPMRSRVTNLYADLSEVPQREYDRIVSIAVFEHLCDLPATIKQCGQLLARDGQLRVAIPSEGTILWTMGWMFTTGVEFRLRHGLDYGVLMRHEHVNTAEEIEVVLRTFFKRVRRSVFGVSRAVSFYQFFECSDFTR